MKNFFRLSLAVALIWACEPDDPIRTGIQTIVLANGCDKVTFYEDVNGNGSLDAKETILSQVQICDGQDGKDGAQGPQGPQGETRSPR